ncbi:MAG TPA: fumarylacetoacetate hydrolase family protein [Candidatus Eremiobacteraceae bacterium]|nr:fumarylacetoacetate hydrolase family protein [Candidatus Eremiobacteraceae bacterium]
MRFVRFERDGRVAEGVLSDGLVAAGGRSFALDSVRLLAPVMPSKIVCVGRNYRDHVAEMSVDLPVEPVLFFKPPSAVLEPGGSIVLPPQSTRVDYEGELGVVIGRRCKNVSRDEALAVVRGYTIVNDVTARDLQRSDVQWARAKGFDTFAPVGPCVADDVDASGLRLRTFVNGEVRQDATTALLIFDVPRLIEYISAAFTLEAGDVIATGTPSGVGQLHPGDEVRVEIEDIGALVNRVVAA